MTRAGADLPRLRACRRTSPAGTSGGSGWSSSRWTATTSWPWPTISDKVGPRAVMIVSLAGAAVMAIIIALRLPPEIPAGIARAGSEVRV